VPQPTDQDDPITQAAYFARDIAPDLDVVLITHYPDVETLDTLRPGKTDLHWFTDCFPRGFYQQAEGASSTPRSSGFAPSPPLAGRLQSLKAEVRSYRCAKLGNG
jgi:hypothetical protein